MHYYILLLFLQRIESEMWLFLHKFFLYESFQKNIIIAEFSKLSFACVLITFFTLSLDYIHYIYTM